MKIIKESKLNEKKSLEDTVYDELLDLGLEVYLSNLYDGYRVEVETEEQKGKVKKVAEKHKLETKEMGHKGYTDIHVIIPDEEELKKREKEEKKLNEAKYNHLIYSNYMVDSDDKIVGDNLERAEAKELTKKIKETAKDYIYVTRESVYEGDDGRVQDFEEIVDVFKVNDDWRINKDKFGIFKEEDKIVEEDCKKETPKKKLTEDYGWEVKRGKEWDLLKLMIDTFGTEEILDNLAQALSRDELGDNLAYICRMLDFDNEYMEDYNDEEEDEEDEEDEIEESCKKKTPKKALKEDENFDEELKKIAKGYQEDLKEIGTDWDKMLAYVEEQLDYDFNIDSKHQYKSAKLWVGLGGPNVCLDTEDGTINVYWGGRKYKEAFPYKINEVLDDVMREIYNSERDSE